MIPPIPPSYEKQCFSSCLGCTPCNIIFRTRPFYLAMCVGTFPDGSQARSPWVHALTLHPSGREKHLGNVDPLDRLSCNVAMAFMVFHGFSSSHGAPKRATVIQAPRDSALPFWVGGCFWTGPENLVYEYRYFSTNVSGSS